MIFPKSSENAKSIVVAEPVVIQVKFLVDVRDHMTCLTTTAARYGKVWGQEMRTDILILGIKWLFIQKRFQGL